MYTINTKTPFYYKKRLISM